MQTEFRAIGQSEYGAPEKVLKIEKRQLKSEEPEVDDALVKVITRPIHPGDIQILSALPQGGPIEPVPEGTLRVPGFEGVGTIVRSEQTQRGLGGLAKDSVLHSFQQMVLGENMWSFDTTLSWRFRTRFPIRSRRRCS
jgi:NADPH:quinone reductase-like Zn-dependent oxidoreductase